MTMTDSGWPLIKTLVHDEYEVGRTVAWNLSGGGPVIWIWKRLGREPDFILSSCGPVAIATIDLPIWCVLFSVRDG